MDNRQPTEKLKADGRHDKQIYRSNVRGLIAEKCLPAL
jgi:hypothetical protein